MKKEWEEKHKAQRSQTADPPRTAALGRDEDLKEKIKKLEAEKKELNKRAAMPAYCVSFLKEGGCFDEKCRFTHVEKDEVEKAKKNRKALAAAEKKKRSQSAGG